MSKVGRKTPVWRNKRTGRVVCGTTVQDALGVGRMCHVGEDWERASSLPPEHRVVINDGSVLPENDISCAIAAEAKATGMLKVKAYGREYSFYVRYLDLVRVIVE